MPPKTMVLSPLCAPPWSHLALIYPLHRAHVFLVGCCMWNIITRPSKATTYFIFVFFALLNSPPRMKRQHPPICSAPAMLPLHHPVHRFRQLLVDCCFFWPNGGYLRLIPPYLSVFWCVLFRCPKQGNQPLESQTQLGRLQQAYREHQHDDLGAPLSYQWKESKADG